MVHNEAKFKKNIISATNVFNRENEGLSKAANQGAKLAVKKFVCLVDDDMTVTEKWDIHLYNAHVLTRSNWVCSTRVEPIPCPSNVSTALYRDGEYDPNKHNWYNQISNTPLLIPRHFWLKIGGYDEDFETIGAELGLAKRAYDNGVRGFVQTPYSVVIHQQSQSTKRLPEIRKHRKKRDETFRRKYNMDRKSFIKLIGKNDPYSIPLAHFI